MILLDLETTSADPETAEIVQLAMVDVHDASRSLDFVCRPRAPVEPEAAATHGHSTESLRAEPPFSEFADEVQVRLLDDDGRPRTLVTYNGRRFDVPILHRELRSAERPGMVTDAYGEISHPEIDLLLCWRILEPRTLEGALDRFGVEKSSVDFHDALSDAVILHPLLDEMAMHFRVSDDVLRSVTTPDHAVDRSGKFRRDDDGRIVFAFGRYSGELARDRANYLRWMISAEFSESTKAVCRRLLEPEPRVPEASP